MHDNYSSYLYYRGENDNPLNSQEDFSLNRHMWWHYEQHHFGCKQHKEEFPLVEDFMRYIVNNKVDYGDPDDRLLNQYKNSSQYSDKL